MPDIFPYSSKISKGISKESKPSVVTSSFGSGYSQRIRQGINTQSDEWTVSFIGQTVSISNSIIAFFEQKAGAESFFFTPPFDSVSYLVVCPEWDIEYTSHISRDIKAKFIRVYDLI